jgi:hypothetical protein
LTTGVKPRSQAKNSGVSPGGVHVCAFGDQRFDTGRIAPADRFHQIFVKVLGSKLRHTNRKKRRDQ